MKVSLYYGLVASIVIAIAYMSWARSNSVGVSVESAQEIAKTKCVEGCLILSKEDLAKLNEQINEAMQEAFKQGLHTCRNSI